MSAKQSDSQHKLALDAQLAQGSLSVMDGFGVICASGSLRTKEAGATDVTHFDHRWTEGGVDVIATFTGAHLLHVAVASCVLNDLYREAGNLGLQLDGVRVAAGGGFADDWASTGIDYRVEVDSPASQEAIDNLLAVVDQVAEIPRAVRAGAQVTRVP